MRNSIAAFVLMSFTIASLALADGGAGEGLFALAGSDYVMTGTTPRRLIHFTFDDGPSTTTTRRLLDELDRLEVKATFFLSGAKLSTSRGDAEEALDIARETARRGHRLASHSFRHTRLDRLSQGALDRELAAAEASFVRIDGTRPELFRPPHGMHNALVDRGLRERSMLLVNWNINPTDYSVRDAASVFHNFQTVLRARERREGSRGGIVLLHDTLPWSREAMPQIVNWIDQRNCELLAAGEELYEISADIRDFIGPSSPSRQTTPDTERQERVRRRAAERCGSAR